MKRLLLGSSPRSLASAVASPTARRGVGRRAASFAAASTVRRPASAPALPASGAAVASPNAAARYVAPAPPVLPSSTKPARPTGAPAASPASPSKTASSAKNQRFLPADQPDIKERYRFTRKLGQGKFGVVFEAVDLQTDELVAVKVLDKARCGPQQCLHELKMMQQIKSEVHSTRFTPIKGVFEDADNIYFVIELLRGGELYDVLEANGKLSEEEAAVVVRKLAFALAALHQHGIIHRDIKLENLVLTDHELQQQQKQQKQQQQPQQPQPQQQTPYEMATAAMGRPRSSSVDNDSVASAEMDEPSEFKITDFGFSQQVGELDAFDTPAGTLGYVAPEVLARRQYGPACDVWSMGVVLYMLLSGQAPFPLHPDADDAQTLKERIEFELEAIEFGRDPKVWYSHLEEEPWAGVSSDAKNLLSKMLKVDPKRRISAEGVLSHPWIKRHQLATWNEYINFE